ncbi:poly(U)-specific endoribonuclease-C-like isoform X2 [Anguilla anguilla]|uniref:poly(U)-specific endoribonuclease-C-like isoform X1 n=1 Tax=Anguilla anguilla TaxID=7936 RepID=UPI0015AEC26C|nr:poly(U)-specific endoribonuclease-C-like isoform X1 [Anguilla anguilla]XP_035283619.1 poly(U)-specific endoribonuclease-C-like isoform X2 [Anguilla anguilla]
MARRCSGRDVSLLLLFFTLTCTLLDASSPVVDQELSDIINELWKLDTNRLKPGTDYTISLQGKAGFVTQGTNTARDHAQSPLFSHVNEAKLKSIKTYSNFLDLLDNYEKSTGVTEKVTPEELAENYRFLDSILQTEVMKRAHKYLVSKGKSSTDLRLFKNQLYDIWFRLYHRDRSAGEDSCGFEHVFVGETKFGKEIAGFHNWVQFYMEEKNHHLDYKGYKARDQDVPDDNDHVLNVQFSWNGLVKPVGSCFIGVSPEFEVALFTIVFLKSTVRVTHTVINVDEYQLEVVVYRHGRSIGTSYPKLLSSNNRHV